MMNFKTFPHLHILCQIQLMISPERGTMYHGLEGRFGRFPPKCKQHWFCSSGLQSTTLYVGKSTSTMIYEESHVQGRNPTGSQEKRHPEVDKPSSSCKINSVTGRVCLLRTKIKILNFKESFLLYLSFSEGFKLV